MGSQFSDEDKLVEQLFGTRQGPEDDFAFFRQRWMTGTCVWILSDPALNQWLDHDSGSRVAWFSAPPASGKSILSAYLIDHIRNTGRCCQYFFLKFGDHTKRSASAFLRSVGLQIARERHD